MLVGEVWLPGRGALRTIPAARRAPHGVQLRLPRMPVGAWSDAGVDPVGACGACARRRARDLGALQSRRHPPGHALRPRRHPLRLRDQARGDADRPRARRRRRARPRRCSRWRCRDRCTSTRARSSGCRRWRTSRRTGARTRCGTARAGWIPGRDGCRVPIPWSGARAAVRLQPERARRRSGSISPTTGRHSRSRRRPATRPRCSACTGPGCVSAARRPGAPTPSCAGSTTATT